ncbi:alpha/beta fold hydrolase [Mesobacterium pallidum]|uniref:alpha/beta fold hydrolase n=1 Tax=Mesobacterium pallidum TaxID=2872037 RepID=UPI001EE19598|nr:alpha/beta fold hydrolase [Mesobacterium pallidum]
MSDAAFPTLLLIHGAWAGPWVWDDLVPALAARGIAARALALPGDGHHAVPVSAVTPEDFRACLADAMEALDGPVALVGHSGGGMLVTSGATWFPDRVSHGIWIAGMLLPGGETFDDIQQRIAGPGRRIGVTPHVLHAEGGRSSSVPEAAAMAHFFQDLPEDVARAAARRLTPQPAAGYRIATPAGPGFATLPKLYVRAGRDRSVLPEAQDMMCDGIPALEVMRMDTGHVPQVADPEGLARGIAAWLGRHPVTGGA